MSEKNQSGQLWAVVNRKIYKLYGEIIQRDFSILSQAREEVVVGRGESAIVSAMNNAPQLQISFFSQASLK
jgi:hypothetical protein